MAPPDAPPGARPSLEFEALLKVFLADQGDKQALPANLRGIQAWAEDEHRRAIQLVELRINQGSGTPAREVMRGGPVPGAAPEAGPGRTLPS